MKKNFCNFELLEQSDNSYSTLEATFLHFGWFACSDRCRFWKGRLMMLLDRSISNFLEFFLTVYFTIV